MKNLLLALILGLLLSNSMSSKNLNIIAIGDSHGASGIGWVAQLKKLRPQDSILNFSIGGNTIGFKNLNRDTLNTLKNIDSYLSQSNAKFNQIDKIIILLGTNDCKAVFDSVQNVVPENLEKLVKFVKEYPFNENKNPDIILCAPPPIPDDSMLIAKYHGGKVRLEKLLPHYKLLAEKYNCKYVDCYNPLLADYVSITEDGIHLKEIGYKQIAELINKAF